MKIKPLILFLCLFITSTVRADVRLDSSSPKALNDSIVAMINEQKANNNDKATVVVLEFLESLEKVEKWYLLAGGEKKQLESMMLKKIHNLNYAEVVLLHVDMKREMAAFLK